MVLVGQLTCLATATSIFDETAVEMFDVYVGIFWKFLRFNNTKYKFLRKLHHNAETKLVFTLYICQTILKFNKFFSFFFQRRGHTTLQLLYRKTIFTIHYCFHNEYILHDYIMIFLQIN